MTNQTIKHHLVPIHRKLSEDEKKKFLEKKGVSANQLPIILRTDSAIEFLNAKSGEIIQIIRESQTAGKVYYYRVVVNE